MFPVPLDEKHPKSSCYHGRISQWKDKLCIVHHTFRDPLQRKRIGYCRDQRALCICLLIDQSVTKKILHVFV